MSEEREELSKIADEVRACRKCPLWKGRINAVPGDGPSNVRVMVVGEGPGRNEDLEGKPFVGAAGRNLEAFLSEAKLSRAEVFLTNVVKCRPPMNRRPSRLEAETCHQYLRRQIKSIKPDVILLLGDTALKQFFPDDSLTEVHGKRLEKGGESFFPTYHPAAVIYNPSLRETLLSDFQKLGELLAG
jgi:DNA polymerase